MTSCVPSLHLHLRAWFAILAFAIFAATGTADAQVLWRQFAVSGDIAYLAETTPSRIVRYNVATRTWLSPIVLAEAPTAMTVDDGQIFVASGRKIERFDLAGTSKVHVANTATDVTWLFVDDDLLLAAASGSISAFSRSSHEVLGSISNQSPLHAVAIDRQGNRLFTRESSLLKAFRYSETGDIRFVDDNYNASSSWHLWVFADGTKLAGNAGSVWNTTDLSTALQFDRPITDLVFLEGSVPIVLSGDTLHGYDRALRPAGSVQLPQAGKKVHLRGTTLLVFHEDFSAPNSAGVEIRDVSALNLPETGAPIDPLGLAFEMTDIAIDAAGVVHILSKPYATIFRWDAVGQHYLSDVPLPAPADRLVYSPAHDRLYTYAASREIHQIDLAPLDPVPNLHALLPWDVYINDLPTIVPLGEDLLATSNSRHRWVYGAAGELLSHAESNDNPSYPIYHEGRRRIFYRDKHLDYLGDGQFGPVVWSSTHNYRALRLSADGLQTVTARGLIYDADTRIQIGTLSNNVVDAVWDDAGTLFTFREPLNLGNWSYTDYEQRTTIQRWSSSYAVERDLVLPGLYRRLLGFGGNLVAIASVDGIPRLMVLDEQLGIVAPTELAAPVASVRAHGVTTAVLEWDFVQGAVSYLIERRRAGDSNWSVIATPSFRETRFVDTRLLSGHVWEYRMRSVNAARLSTWSQTEVIDLTAAVVRVDPQTVLFGEDDVAVDGLGRAYILSRAHRSLFVWNIASRSWSRTIPLLGEPSRIVWSEANRVLYLAYPDRIDGIDVDAPEPSEFFFAYKEASGDCGLVAADPYLVVCEDTGLQRSLDGSGNMIDRTSWSGTLEGAAWSPNRRVVYFRYHMSSFANWATVGGDGALGDSQWLNHSWTSPLWAAPDGTYVLSSEGIVRNAESWEEMASLDGPITDATWIGTQLVTASGQDIRTHITGSHIAEVEATMPNVLRRIFALSDGRVLAVTRDGQGQVELTLLDSDFTTIPPPMFSDGFE